MEICNIYFERSKIFENFNLKHPIPDLISSYGIIATCLPFMPITTLYQKLLSLTRDAKFAVVMLGCGGQLALLYGTNGISFNIWPIKCAASFSSISQYECMGLYAIRLYSKQKSPRCDHIYIRKQNANFMSRHKDRIPYAWPVFAGMWMKNICWFLYYLCWRVIMAINPSWLSTVNKHNSIVYSFA